jgi:hypothetical protein
MGDRVTCDMASFLDGQTRAPAFTLHCLPLANARPVFGGCSANGGARWPWPGSHVRAEPPPPCYTPKHPGEPPHAPPPPTHTPSCPCACMCAPLLLLLFLLLCFCFCFCSALR